MNNRPPVLYPIAPGWRKIKEDYTIHVNGEEYKIPKGFIYNGNSAPPFSWWYIGHPFSYRLIVPSLFHDYMYRTKELSRRTADHYYYLLLLDANVRKRKAYFAWLMVRLFGRRYYG